MRVALVVPEYRHGGGGQGGLATVADYLIELVGRAGGAVDLISVRMSSRAAESRRLLRPKSWLTPRVPTTRSDGRPGWSIGSHIAEIEAVRYLPRRRLDDMMDLADVVVVVAGTPAFAHVARHTKRPVVLQVATTLDMERAHRRAESRRGPGARARALMSVVASRMDLSGLLVPDVIVTENEYMRSFALASGAQWVEFCPPGVDTTTFKPPSGQRAERHIVMVARLGDPRKDLATLISAYALARRGGCVLPMVLAGRGQVSPSVNELVRALNLGEHVSIRSDVPRGELVTLMQEAAFFVSSSREEGLGLAAIEGMACGLPLVATATEGTRTVLADSSAGEIVAIGDSASLGDAICRWAGNTSLRQRGSEAARRRAVEVFGLEATDARWIDLLDRVVRASRR